VAQLYQGLQRAEPMLIFALGLSREPCILLFDEEKFPKARGSRRSGELTELTARIPQAQPNRLLVFMVIHRDVAPAFGQKKWRSAMNCRISSGFMIFIYIRGMFLLVRRYFRIHPTG
jgi:hypothetical protein